VSADRKIYGLMIMQTLNATVPPQDAPMVAAARW
jgi:hypothetical protein